MSEQTNAVEHLDENHVIAERRAKLAHIREQRIAFPNTFKRDTLAQALHEAYADYDKAALAELTPPVTATLAGRIMLKRVMGKASFFTLQDASGQMQVYLRGQDIGESRYEEVKHWDLGDIVGVTGFLFRTNTGELSIHATSAELLTKSLRPLPDKFHGLHDTEVRYRQRYVDLIVNQPSRETFRRRSLIIAGIRQFMIERGFLEVETPMMHPIPGGAAAKPFVTHHNALDMPLYLRIAPELYLKRLVVGGFEQVFEINRNFRNEGLSARHNPEFTMMEFYWAYADYKDLMDMTEALLSKLALDVTGSTELNYQGTLISFAGPFERLSIKQSILKYNADVTAADLEDMDALTRIVEAKGFKVLPGSGLGKVQNILFEETVEHQLIQPTFITEYPAEVSPLARRNDDNPEVTDRFELFIGGREIANGFSELNDSEDQAERFLEQARAKEAGDDEAMHYDADYIRALEYGLPPTAGEGIGIDRLVMLLTDAPSIRDVLLFPQMRHEEHS
ncbi:MAG: lysine--tRNA ligase [Gammaproteobacteria bacterium]|nr:lysine--tRNA ligase [Gammaproteobacteria bacterium]